MMYGLMATISLLVRQFCLPNPFECFGDMALLYNLVAGLVLAPLSYVLVGLVYSSGDAPALGSFLYLMTYAILTGILWVLGQFSFAWWAIAIMITVVVGTIFLLSKIRGDFY